MKAAQRNTLALTLWVLLLLVAGWTLSSNLRVRTDLSSFMPPASTPTERVLLDELRDGHTARIILLALQGGSLQQRTTAGKALARRLRKEPRLLRVLNGDKALNEQDLERLLPYRYLLEPGDTAAHYSIAALHESLRQRLRELASPAAPFVKHLVTRDPTGALQAVLAAWTPRLRPAKRHGVWVSGDERFALLLLETRAPGFDLRAQQQVVESIERAFAQLPNRADLELILSGPAVFAVQAQRTIRTETLWLSTLATLLVFGFLLLVYRSVAWVLLLALPLFTGLLVATAAVAVVFDTVQGITLAFGITLLGVAIDYPIHLFSHTGPKLPAESAIRSVWPTMRLGVLTTCLGYAAMLSTDFGGLRQLGWFTIVGLVTAAGVTRWVLPLLMSRPPQRVFVWESVRAWLRPPPARLRTAFVLAVLLPSAWTIAQRGEYWENDLAALSPVTAELRNLDTRLRTELGGPEVRYLLLVTGTDAQTVLQRSERLGEQLDALVAAGTLHGYELAAKYLPSHRTQLERRRQLPTQEKLATNLRLASQGLAFKPGAFEPFLRAVAKARSLAPLGPEDLANTPMGLRIDTLLSPYQNGWRALVPLSGVTDAKALEGLLGNSAGKVPGVFFLDLKGASERIVGRFRLEALERLTLGAVAIMAVLIIALRDPRRVIAVVLPVGLALLADIALLLAMGERLSLFHLVSLLLVVGIGIDYGLFFSRREVGDQGRLQVFHALTSCMVSTTVVFGLLAWSRLPVLHAIGSTVSIGVALNFLAALVLAQRPLPMAAAPVNGKSR